jgi:hypothetical protein
MSIAITGIPQTPQAMLANVGQTTETKTPEPWLTFWFVKTT